MVGREEVREVGGRRLVLTSLDKLVWPAAGFTKRDLVAYYESVAPALVPHLAGRPLTLGRFPDGIGGPGFAQTECRGRPDWMRTFPIRLRSGELRDYCLLDDLPSLLWVVNLGTIELHTFLGRAPELERPAGVLLDLDPREPAGVTECARVALELRGRLEERGLTAVAKTSGSLGLHVLVPLNAPHTYDETRAFARELAGRLDPGPVAVDWAQNSERRTTAAPYSLRATDTPSVSAPLAWREVERLASGGPLDLAPAAVARRVAERGDLFEPALTAVQRI
jgi:bifunctional non-homologous end joining protein LigD